MLRRTFSDFLPDRRIPRPARRLLWPLYYSGAIAEYPSILHARLMIEGFLASFIIGFLGTAGPRITSAPHFTRREVLLPVTLDLLAAALLIWMVKVLPKMIAAKDAFRRKPQRSGVLPPVAKGITMRSS